MLCKARIDALGALHQIILRGIEGRRMFSGDQERDNFINRLLVTVTETKTIWFSWVLIPKRSHFCCGPAGLSSQCHRTIQKAGYLAEPSVSRYVKRGEKIVKAKQLKLFED